MLGVLLTKWTIRLALICYVACLAVWLSQRGGARYWHAARVVWTLGCVLFDVHVACAFHFYHHWSHAIAWQHTAERTRELLGVAVGDGIYFSYLFLVLWIVDVLWLWRPASTPKTPAVVSRRSPGGSLAASASADAIAVPDCATGSRATPRWRVVIHVFLLFIAINGAIVFEAGPTRWAGAIVCLGLGCLTVRRAYNSWRGVPAVCRHRVVRRAPADATA